MTLVMERGWKPNVDISPNCPRCGCSNTKFCYYNNYSLTQPRYFCKGCRRYWTKGGSLRNVPVGGGCRKNRRGKSLRLSAATTTEAIHCNPLGYSHSSILAHHDHRYSTNNSVMSDGSHIDIALVYANFLNQKPDSKCNSIGSEMPEFPSDHFDPNSLEFPSMADHISNVGSSSVNHFSHENVGCDGSAENLYLCGLDSFDHHKHQDGSDFGLPPLPAQEVASQEILWTSTTTRTMVGHAMQSAATQPPLLGHEADHLQVQNLVFNGTNTTWSPFDLPISDDDSITFSRT
ncbi:hypothetical protein FNV43_RR16670 [Rhamnella rubrinervis]|uniref:Dof zinc finger protein n=1 Tax=Rhamnella rubrinervis TaxID=2594499 RepID=A0A8K0GZA5_9ROSA|nr:hypothetical protein FNV43_RR16670 [Rhamnella rubrinervis]